MFTHHDFEIFKTEGLKERMAEIKEEIQPKFQEIGTFLKQELEDTLQEELFLHIAQHKRRTVYPPESTWLAIGSFKRGYKMAPHFQLRISNQGVAYLLSIIDQPKKQVYYAQKAKENIQLFQALPCDFILSKDHTKERYFPLQDEIEHALDRLERVKKSEVEIGRFIQKKDHLFETKEDYFTFLKETYAFFIPIWNSYNKEGKKEEK